MRSIKLVLSVKQFGFYGKFLTCHCFTIHATFYGIIRIYNASCNPDQNVVRNTTQQVDINFISQNSMPLMHISGYSDNNKWAAICFIDKISMFHIVLVLFLLCSAINAGVSIWLLSWFTLNSFELFITTNNIILK